MKLVYYPHEALRKISSEVENPLKEKQLVHQLIKVMKQNKGLGLAAPQLGINKKVFVMDQEGEPVVCFNPQIVHIGDEKITWEEGCLSLPGIRAIIERPKVIEVSYLDELGKNQKKTFEGLDSVCFQHELDHLNGILYFDHLSAGQKILLLQEYHS